MGDLPEPEIGSSLDKFNDICNSFPDGIGDGTEVTGGDGDKYDPKLIATREACAALESAHKNEFTNVRPYRENGTNFVQWTDGKGRERQVSVEEFQKALKGDRVNPKITRPKLQKAIKMLLPDADEANISKMQENADTVFKNDPVVIYIENVENLTLDPDDVFSRAKDDKSAEEIADKSGDKSNVEKLKDYLIEKGKKLGKWIVIATPFIGGFWLAVHEHQLNMNGCWLIEGAGGDDENSTDVVKCKVAALSCGDSNITPGDAGTGFGSDGFVMCNTPGNMFVSDVNPCKGEDCSCIDKQDSTCVHKFNPVYKNQPTRNFFQGSGLKNTPTGCLNQKITIKGKTRYKTASECDIYADNYYLQGNSDRKPPIPFPGTYNSDTGVTGVNTKAAARETCPGGDDKFVHPDCTKADANSKFFMFKKSDGTQYRLKPVAVTWGGSLGDLGDKALNSAGLPSLGKLWHYIRIALYVIAAIVGLSILIKIKNTLSGVVGGGSSGSSNTLVIRHEGLQQQQSYGQYNKAAGGGYRYR